MLCNPKERDDFARPVQLLVWYGAEVKSVIGAPPSTRVFVIYFVYSRVENN